MLKYLIALINKQAPSFCYYKNETAQSDTPELMPMETLKNVITFAQSQNLSINFLGISSSLPKKYIEEINSYENHAKFISITEEGDESNSIFILDSHQKDIIKDLKDSALRNIILRLEKKHINDFLPIVQSLLIKCKRLNLCLLDVYEYDQDDLKSYKSQLDDLGKILVSEYKAGHPIEFNFLSDRILLKGMNNCNAGIEHITVGPNGNFYICPGFYEKEKQNSVGNLTEGLHILNKQLLEIGHAPICSICDAYHCKRCIYLNKKSTLEVNTPSYQQCATSHLERDTSRIMLTELKEVEPFNEMDPIEELDYIDPLLVLTGKIKKKMPGKPEMKNNPVHKEEIKPKDNFIEVKDGDKIIKLPRMKQVIPGRNNKKDPDSTINKKVNNLNTKNELDTESTKGLLLEILKTQREILEVLKKKQEVLGNGKR
ncbi:MAG: CXXX repeat peptide maturase [Spirochaetales bacterium]|nr:CXXX repeat peptide maturase [Spirochaetales bacterium]